MTLTAGYILEIVAKNRDVDALKVLLSKFEADVNPDPKNAEYYDPLFVALDEEFAAPEVKAIVEALLPFGFNIDRTTADGENPALHKAVRTCNIENVQAVLECHANASSVDEGGRNASEIARLQKTRCRNATAIMDLVERFAHQPVRAINRSVCL